MGMESANMISQHEEISQDTNDQQDINYPGKDLEWALQEQLHSFEATLQDTGFKKDQDHAEYPPTATLPQAAIRNVVNLPKETVELPNCNGQNWQHSQELPETHDIGAAEAPAPVAPSRRSWHPLPGMVPLPGLANLNITDTPESHTSGNPNNSVPVAAPRFRLVEEASKERPLSQGFENTIPPSGLAAGNVPASRLATGSAPAPGLAAGNAPAPGLAAGNAPTNGLDAGNSPVPRLATRSVAVPGLATESGLATGNTPAPGMATESAPIPVPRPRNKKQSIEIPPLPSRAVIPQEKPPVPLSSLKPKLCFPEEALAGRNTDYENVPLPPIPFSARSNAPGGNGLSSSYTLPSLTLEQRHENFEGRGAYGGHPHSAPTTPTDLSPILPRNTWIAYYNQVQEYVDKEGDISGMGIQLRDMDDLKEQNDPLDVVNVKMNFDLEEFLYYLPNLKRFLEWAQVRDKDLKDERVRHAIRDLIYQNGGMDMVEKKYRPKDKEKPRPGGGTRRVIQPVRAAPAKPPRARKEEAGVYVDVETNGSMGNFLSLKGRPPTPPLPKRKPRGTRSNPFNKDTVVVENTEKPHPFTSHLERGLVPADFQQDSRKISLTASSGDYQQDSRKISLPAPTGDYQQEFQATPRRTSEPVASRDFQQDPAPTMRHPTPPARISSIMKPDNEEGAYMEGPSRSQKMEASSPEILRGQEITSQKPPMWNRSKNLWGKVRASDIGAPSRPQHVFHVGQDPVMGFSVQYMETELSKDEPSANYSEMSESSSEKEKPKMYDLVKRLSKTAIDPQKLPFLRNSNSKDNLREDIPEDPITKSTFFV